MLSERWNWLDDAEFRKVFGFEDRAKYFDSDILKAIRYGCERVDLESGGAITQILGKDNFPGKLTKLQSETVKEAVGWCANHMVRQGLEWLRGSQSVSLGAINTGQTNPEEPDYFLPPKAGLRNKLVQVGLLKFIQTANIPTKDNYGFDEWKEETDRINNYATRDFLKMAYLAKKGQNSLVSKDKTVTVRPSGGLYDGIDLSIEDLLMHRITYENGLSLRSEIDEKDGSLRFRLGFLSFPGGGDGIPLGKIEEWIRKAVKELGEELDEKIQSKFKELDQWGEDFTELVNKRLEELKKWQDKVREENDKWQKKTKKELLEELIEAFKGKIEGRLKEFKDELDKEVADFEEETDKKVGEANKTSKHAEEIATSVRKDADEGKFDGKPGPKGDRGSQGSRGASGSDGVMSWNDHEEYRGRLGYRAEGYSGEILHSAQLHFSRLSPQRLSWYAIYNAEVDTDDEYYHVMSLAAHRRDNLKEFKEYGLIDYEEGKRKKPEKSEDYDKLTEEEKKEIEPKVTKSYFKELKADYETFKPKVLKEVEELKAQNQELLTKLNHIMLELKKGES